MRHCLIQTVNLFLITGLIKDVTGNYSVAGAGGKDVDAAVRCSSCRCRGHCVFQHVPYGSSSITFLMSVIVADVQDAAHLYDVKNDSEVVNEAHVFVKLNNANYQVVTNLFSDAEDETN